MYKRQIKDLLEKYRPFVNSDGYNKTFLKYSLERRWPSFFTAEFGILDSVKVETKFNNEVKTFYLNREKISKEEKKKEETANKKLTKSETGKIKDYNILTKSYNRDSVSYTHLDVYKRQIHYSVDGISKNYGMQTALKNLYKEKALVPASPWIKTEKLEKPVLNIEKSGIFTNVSWISIQQESCLLYTSRCV